MQSKAWKRSTQHLLKHREGRRFVWWVTRLKDRFNPAPVSVESRSLDQHLRTYPEGTPTNDFLWVNKSKVCFPNHVPSSSRQLAQYRWFNGHVLTSRFPNASEGHLGHWKSFGKCDQLPAKYRRINLVARGSLTVQLLDTVVLDETPGPDSAKDWNGLYQVRIKERDESPHISPSVLAGS